MSLYSRTILGISITTNSKEEILEEIQKYLKSSPNFLEKLFKKRKKPLVIVTPNPEQVVLAQKNSQFRDVLNQPDIAIPDGIGIVWASKILGPDGVKNGTTQITERIPGVELMENLVRLAAEKGYRIGLIGGREGLAIKAFECLQKKHPSLDGWGQDTPELKIQSSELLLVGNDKKDAVRTYFNDVIQYMLQSKTQILFVGLGAPKQEFFVQQLSKANFSHPIIFMSVGGSFATISGASPRAPGEVRDANFEWLWRLMLEPWRWRRQLALIEFIRLVLRTRFFKDSM